MTSAELQTAEPEGFEKNEGAQQAQSCDWSEYDYSRVIDARLKADVPKIVYPIEARRARVQGTVIVDCLIDENGGIVDVCVRCGPAELSDAVTEVLRSGKVEFVSDWARPAAGRYIVASFQYDFVLTRKDADSTIDSRVVRP